VNDQTQINPDSPGTGRRLSVAPMMDWTDRHCRVFHRQITKHTWLYTEMVTTGALIHGDVERHLRYDDVEHPIALQLGGSDPADLAKSAKLGEQMQEPQLVADCVKAMRDAVSIDVTVKHRIGIDYNEEYGFVRDFIGTIADAGCRTFIVHARNAVLKGLSPKENREIPPLRYEVAYQLKREFPDLEIIINGGIKTDDEIAMHLQHVDGVMIGREAYHNPYVMAGWDARFYGDATPPKTREQVLEAMIPYIRAELDRYGPLGLRLNSITRHMLGLMAGLPGARGYRQMLSDSRRLAEGNPELLLEAAGRLRLAA
jgi:tRNA-dihydrouridine synthase A